jgi:hypothetical protein
VLAMTRLLAELHMFSLVLTDATLLRSRSAFFLLFDAFIYFYHLVCCWHTC